LVYTTPTPYYPALLILDGYIANTRNLEITESSRENTVTILCLPPHLTHALQPVDVSLVYPLITYYVAALEKGTNNLPCHVVRTFEISCICDEARLEAASPVTAIKVFCRCGFLFDRNIFSETNILAGEFTDQGDQSEKFLQEAANTAERVNDSQTSVLESVDQPAFPLAIMINNQVKNTALTFHSLLSQSVLRFNPCQKLLRTKIQKQQKAGIVEILTSRP